MGLKSSLWAWVALPLLHWLAVSLGIILLGKLAEAMEAAAKDGERALLAPVPFEMQEVSLQVTRADGRAEPPRTYRTYRNPFRQWAWAITQAFKGEK